MLLPVVRTQCVFLRLCGDQTTCPHKNHCKLSYCTSLTRSDLGLRVCLQAHEFILPAPCLFVLFFSKGFIFSPLLSHCKKEMIWGIFAVPAPLNLDFSIRVETLKAFDSWFISREDDKMVICDPFWKNRFGSCWTCAFWSYFLLDLLLFLSCTVGKVISKYLLHLYLLWTTSMTLKQGVLLGICTFLVRAHLL